MLVCCSLSGGITRAIRPVSGFCNSHDRFCEPYRMTAAALWLRNSPGLIGARPRSPQAAD